MTPLEVAARAWFDRVQAQRLDEGRKRPDGKRWQWEDLTEDDQRGYCAVVLPIVEALEEDARRLRVVAGELTTALAEVTAERDRLLGGHSDAEPAA